MSECGFGCMSVCGFVSVYAPTFTWLPQAEQQDKESGQKLSDPDRLWAGSEAP